MHSNAIYIYTTLHNTATQPGTHNIYTIPIHVPSTHMPHSHTHSSLTAHATTYSALICIQKEHYIFSICTVYVICNTPHNHTFHIFFTYIRGMLYTITQIYITNIQYIITTLHIENTTHCAYGMHTHYKNRAHTHTHKAG